VLCRQRRCCYHPFSPRRLLHPQEGGERWGKGEVSGLAGRGRRRRGENTPSLSFYVYICSFYIPALIIFTLSSFFSGCPVCPHSPNLYSPYHLGQQGNVYVKHIIIYYVMIFCMVCAVVLGHELRGLKQYLQLRLCLLPPGKTVSHSH
jgi:hypothetical protein